MVNIFLDKLNLLKDFSIKAGISDTTIEALSHPEHLIKVSLPLKMDDGSLKVVTGYRCRYSTLLGPAKGGVRYHHSADENTLNVLGLGMVLKTSLMGLPYGGGKGEVIIDPFALSENELERLSRLYMRAIAPFIGPMIDIPAPDVNTNSKIMGWMLEEYENYVGHKSPAVITGKPIEDGGSYFRTEATGYGVCLIAKFLMEKLGKELSKTTVAIQGFGNLGSHLAQFLQQEGFKVVVVSDVSGGIYDPNGLTVDVIAKLKANNPNLITKFKDDSIKNAKNISNEELLKLDVDILIPAALDGVINKDNANNIRAKYIIEGANSAVTKTAIEILEAKNILVLPDILCNSGGVIVSYFEWVQNLQCFYWAYDEVKQKLTDKMKEVFENVWEIRSKEQKNFVESSYYVALRRLEERLKSKYNL